MLRINKTIKYAHDSTSKYISFGTFMKIYRSQNL